MVQTLWKSVLHSHKHVLTVGPCDSTMCLPKRNEKPREKKMPTQLV